MSRLELVEAFEEKLDLVARLRGMLDGVEASEAERDGHARRAPRPCGLTIHPATGCSFGCLYCYIYDMGFGGRPRPYPLSGVQLAYAVARNPYVAVGRDGTMLAFGAVTEPFMEAAYGRTLEYLESVRRFLGNPVQLSTKASLGVDDAFRIVSAAGRLSALVTIVTLRFHGLLEPGAPPPSHRFETIEAFSSADAHVSLFLRPLVPGIGEDEVREMVGSALERGARGIVVGSMRVTAGIVRRLRASGYPHIEEILSRVPGRLGDGQVTLRSGDLKEAVVRVAEELGAKIYPSACSANVEAHGLSCAACRMGPCGDPKRLPDFDPDEVPLLAERFGVKVRKVELDGFRLRLRVEKGTRRRKERFAHFLKALVKRRIELLPKSSDEPHPQPTKIP